MSCFNLRTRQLLVIICNIIILLVLTSCNANNTKTDIVSSPTEKQLSSGEVFNNGSFIEVEDVNISYNGKYFIVHNNRSDVVRISCSVVGVKKDGSYDVIQLSDFGGTDIAQYEKDKTDNGWAIKQRVNLIRPNEVLEATLNIFDFSKMDEDYPKNDIDSDGYYDILFTISPQIDEKTITISSTDPKSKIYKIKVN